MSVHHHLETFAIGSPDSKVNKSTTLKALCSRSITSARKVMKGQEHNEREIPPLAHKNMGTSSIALKTELPEKVEIFNKIIQ